MALTAGVAITIRGGATPAVPSGPTGQAASAVDRTKKNDGAALSSALNAERPATSVDASRAGVASYARGDVAGSIAQFTDAVAASPTDAQALNNLGQALVRAGRAREAIPYFDRAIGVNDGSWTYHFNRARAYSELQEWERAIAGYRESARLFPDDYATAFNLGRALQASGNLSGAIVAYERAITLAPGEPDFQLSLAFAYETAQKPAEAVRVYRRYLELQDSGPAAEKVRRRLQELESKQ